MARTSRLTGILCGLWAGAVAASVRAGGSEPFGAPDVVSRIGVERVADEAGDPRLAAALRAPDKREAALIAARAAPYADAPELLIPGLARLASGRDPQLAPEAASALAAIGQRLSLSELAAREALLTDLKAAQTALRDAASAPALRPDIAVALGDAQAALSALGIAAD